MDSKLKYLTSEDYNVLLEKATVSIYQTNDMIEDGLLQWNTILDWNCKNIVYPNKIVDSPIIKFKFNYSYINDEERKLYHTYWQCKKNILPLKPYTSGPS